MIKIFFCEYTGNQVFTHSWWCDSCNKHADRREIARGPADSFENIPWESVPPIRCPNCGGSAAFSARGAQRIFRRLDTGEEITKLRDHPGACFEEPEGYYDRYTRQKRTGPDGRVLSVVLPDGFTWCIDSRASNCTKKDDNEHRCWVRHGRPEDGTLHVDKNGLTCDAGAGSILSDNYHGFLHNGYLTSC